MFEVYVTENVCKFLESDPRCTALYGYHSGAAAVVVSTTLRAGLDEVGVAVTRTNVLGEMADGVVEVLVEGEQFSGRVSVEGVWAPAAVHRISTRRDLQARNEGLVPATTLEHSTVAVVGLGSVGSQLARYLAQAGVGHLVLIDPDRFAPPNVSRHVLDLASVGKSKVSAMAEVLRRINPDLTTTPLQLAVGHQTLERVTDALKDCSLVVIATDSVEANRATQIACLDAGQIPAVAVGCWDRAEAGEIIVSDTRRGTPCYGCVRAALPSIPSSRGSSDYMLDGDPTPPNIGLGVDVGFVTTVSAKVCLAVLTDDRELGLLDDEHSVLLVSTRPGGVFASACQVSPVRAVRDPACWLCGHLYEEGIHAK